MTYFLDLKSFRKYFVATAFLIKSFCFQVSTTISMIALHTPVTPVSRLKRIVAILITEEGVRHTTVFAACFDKPEIAASQLFTVHILSCKTRRMCYLV